MRSTSTAKFVLALFAMSVAGPGWSTQAGRQPAPSAEIDRAWKLVEQGRATEAMKVANALLATMTPRDSWWSAAQLVSAVAAGAAGKYATAAIAFHKIYVEAPQSNEAPTALVGLAGAMFELGKSPDACNTLRQGVADYGERLSAGLKARVKELAARANCGDLGAATVRGAKAPTPVGAAATPRKPTAPSGLISSLSDPRLEHALQCVWMAQPIAPGRSWTPASRDRALKPFSAEYRDKLGLYVIGAPINDHPIIREYKRVVVNMKRATELELEELALSC